MTYLEIKKHRLMRQMRNYKHIHYLFIFLCVCVVYACTMCAHVEARGKHLVFSSVTVHLITFATRFLTNPD